jgi:hypothetical protein
MTADDKKTLVSLHHSEILPCFRNRKTRDILRTLRQREWRKNKALEVLNITRAAYRPDYVQEKRSQDS